MPKVLSADATPNENAMKFTIEGKAIESGSATYKADTASENPVAASVFKVSGVVAVFLLNDFITVTKAPEESWSNLRDAVVQAIEQA